MDNQTKKSVPESQLPPPKTHYNDAVAICYEDRQTVKLDNTVYHKKHISTGDFQQTKGARSEKKIDDPFVFD